MGTFEGIIFDSHNEYFRSPLGAIKCGDTLTLRILISKSLSAYGVTVRLWDNGEEKLFSMVQGATYNNTPYGDFLEEYHVSFTHEAVGLLWYQFHIFTPSRPIYAVNGEDNLGGECVIKYERCDNQSYQVLFYDKAFETPAWAKGAVMYQIFPDRFYKSGEVAFQNRKHHEKWNEMPEYLPDEDLGYYAANDFFGGNLKGIAEKLDYLKSLNIDVIYLNPIFKAYSNHRYDCGDYERIDETLGTQADFEDLCAKARAKNIRIILDGVFSHTGSNSKYFNKDGEYETLGAYQSVQSPYYEWYSFESFPDKYDCWWGVWSLPCVNELSESYLKYTVTDESSISKRWLRAGAGGWRLDVADELPDEYIKEFRKSIKSVDGDALLIGEVWEDATNKISYSRLREFLYGLELDSVMNYPLRNAIVDLLIGKSTTNEFCRRVKSLQENYPPEAFYCLMNFLSTHDLERITTRLCYSCEELSRNEQAQLKYTEEQLLTARSLHKLGALIIFTLPGMPCIYYGDEMSLLGGKDPFNRKPFPWDSTDLELLEWYKALSSIHKSSELKKGKLSLYCAGSLLIIKRAYNKKIYALINVSDETVETLVDTSFFESCPQVLCTSVPGLQINERENGWYLLLPPYCGTVVRVD